MFFWKKSLNFFLGRKASSILKMVLFFLLSQLIVYSCFRIVLFGWRDGFYSADGRSGIPRRRCFMLLLVAGGGSRNSWLGCFRGVY